MSPSLAMPAARRVLGLCFLFALPALALWGEPYSNYDELSHRLRELREQHPEVVRLESLAMTRGGRTVWRLELGTVKDRSRSPAMLAVGGLEGRDLLGTASLVYWAKTLADGYASDPAIRRLLDSTTIHLIPRLNPDAAESYFATPRAETTVSGTPVDDDHDGLLDEDGVDDLDGDGVITWMRVKDPDGEYQLDPKEPRLLLKADASKGERGEWRLFSEGTDQDKDEAWNEDGAGGVNYNSNFPYKFRFFGAGSGPRPMSEEVTRRLADFVIDHPEIGLVFTFGSSDNLLQTPKEEAAKRPPSGVHEKDLPWIRELGKEWRKSLGLTKELTGNSEPGSFSEWVYYHRGRLSLAAQPWNPAIQLAVPPKKPDSETDEKETKPAEGSSKQPAAKPAANQGEEGSKEGQEERAFLKWLDQNAPEEFVPWRAIEHPDFPGQLVEIGGFAPFAKVLPPPSQMDLWRDKHVTWLTALAAKLPRIGIRNVKVKPLGNAVFDISVQVENTGYLPTALAQGEITREVYPTRVELGVDPSKMLSGSRRAVLPIITGSGGMQEARFIVNGKGLSTVEVRVVSMLGGTVVTEVTLPEEK